MKRDEIDDPQKRPRVEQRYGGFLKKLFSPLRFDCRGRSTTAMKLHLTALAVARSAIGHTGVMHISIGLGAMVAFVAGLELWVVNYEPDIVRVRPRGSKSNAAICDDDKFSDCPNC